MAEETKVQHLIHSLEQGQLAIVVRTALFATLIVALVLLYLFVQFRGLANEAAMDQAQIARQISEGHGFSTQYIRPLAIYQLSAEGKKIPEDHFPDLSNTPLWPALNAVLFKITGAAKKMSVKDPVQFADRLIAATSIGFFLLSVALAFFIGRKLFDTKLSLIGCAAILLTDLFWQFSLSGLPHMFLLFLFMLAGLAIIYALEAQRHDERKTMLFLLVVASVLFGLMTLTHGLACWIFIGFAVFVGIVFQPRVLTAVVICVVYLAVVSPWMIRNYQVCGNPLGISGYTMASYRGAEAVLSRSLNPDFREAAQGFRNKMRLSLVEQAESLFANLGMNIAAIAFLGSLLHRFRNRTAGAFRWCVFSMWFFAVLGMALFDAGSGTHTNQLSVLFIPLMVFFGLAFLFVLFGRLEIHAPVIRFALVTVILFACSVPMLLTLFAGSPGRVHWPPYIPPYIAILGKWTEPKEVLASDMPWAVAWYANRKCVLLPDSVKAFNEISDYQLLGHRIVGLYLTPITGNRAFIRDIAKGAYKEWAGFITRTVNLKGFALQSKVSLPMDGECIFYSDRDRWDADR